MIERSLNLNWYGTQHKKILLLNDISFFVWCCAQKIIYIKHYTVMLYKDASEIYEGNAFIKV
jgi:hypothetical protein